MPDWKDRIAMAYLPNDPRTAEAHVIARVQDAEHRRGLWAPLDKGQGRQIGKLIAADRKGQLTKPQVLTTIELIARWTR